MLLDVAIFYLIHPVYAPQCFAVLLTVTMSCLTVILSAIPIYCHLMLRSICSTWEFFWTCHC